MIMRLWRTLQSQSLHFLDLSVQDCAIGYLLFIGLSERAGREALHPCPLVGKGANSLHPVRPCGLSVDLLEDAHQFRDGGFAISLSYGILHTALGVVFNELQGHGIER